MTKHELITSLIILAVTMIPLIVFIYKIGKSMIDDFTPEEKDDIIRNLLEGESDINNNFKI